MAAKIILVYLICCFVAASATTKANYWFIPQFLRWIFSPVLCIFVLVSTGSFKQLYKFIYVHLFNGQ